MENATVGTQVQLEQQLQALVPLICQIENESANHAGPATDSHFKVVLVSECFSDLSRVKRHQLVYQQVASLLAGPVHALALHTYTPQEWAARSGASPQSPACQGGA